MLVNFFQVAVYFNLADFGRFVLEELSVNLTAVNLGLINAALNSAELSVSSATSIRQKFKKAYDKLLKSLKFDAESALVVFMTYGADCSRVDLACQADSHHPGPNVCTSGDESALQEHFTVEVKHSWCTCSCYVTELVCE